MITHSENSWYKYLTSCSLSSIVLMSKHNETLKESNMYRYMNGETRACFVNGLVCPVLYSYGVCFFQQDEELLRREREHRDLSSKLDASQQQLDELRRRGAAAVAATEAHRDRESRWESERRSLQEAAAEAEAQSARLDVARAALEGDQRRLRMALDDKEAEAAALSAKCRGLSAGVAKLEEKCSEMAATVDGLNSQLERSAGNEAELQARVDELSRSLAATSSNSSSVHEQLAQLQRSLRQAEAEKEVRQ